MAKTSKLSGSPEVKTALVHDWLTGMRGGERVLEAIYELYPSPVYTLIRTKNFKSDVIDLKKVTSSSIQKIPFASKYYRNMLSLFPKAIEEFDLSGYDLVLSTSHAVAKGVLTHANQLHICYMHTPMRYAWDKYFQYLNESNLLKGPLSRYVKNVLFKIRAWDFMSASRVDHYIANSNYIARRIKKTYNRDATVIYPPVDTGKFTLSGDKEDFYLTASQFAPYKKIDLIVQAFRTMPDRKLVVIGDGPERDKIRKHARGAKNIELLGYQPDEVLKEKLQKAKAFVFAAEEDFGILPVEAQACGTPVIAFARGGAAETVIDGKTGLFFEEQTVDAVRDAVAAFDRIEDKVAPSAVRKNAERFSREVFLKKYSDFVEKKYGEFRNGLKRGKA
jgi:glycosyltransferase involved in cell wall biosynthesis